MKRLPTQYEMRQKEKQKKKDMEIIGGVCMIVLVIAAGLLLIG